MHSKRLRSMGYGKSPEEWEWMEQPKSNTSRSPEEVRRESRKGVTYIFSLILLFIGGIGLIAVSMLNKSLELGLDKSLATIVGGMGILCLISMGIVLWFYLNFLMLQDEKWEIEEKDERNIMIRGITAKYGKPIFPLVMLVVEMILLLSGNVDAGLLVAIGVAVATIADLILYAFMQKKY